MAGYSAPAENLSLLDRLIRTRGEMADTQGAQSYAHLTLHNATLAETPEAVQSFLLELAAAIRPKVSFGVGYMPSYRIGPELCAYKPGLPVLHGPLEAVYPSAGCFTPVVTCCERAACKQVVPHAITGGFASIKGGGRDRAAALVQGAPRGRGCSQRAPGCLGPPVLHRARQGAIQIAAPACMQHVCGSCARDDFQSLTTAAHDP